MSDYYLAEYDRWLDLCAEEYNEYIDWLDRGRKEAYWADMHQQMHDEDLIWEEEQYYEKADKLHDLDKEDGK